MQKSAFLSAETFVVELPAYGMQRTIEQIESTKQLIDTCVVTRHVCVHSGQLSGQ